MGADGEKAEFDLRSYKKFYEIWVRSSSEMMEEIMRSPHFAAMAGKMLDTSVDMKRQIDEVIETSLKGMHLPTSSDFKELSRRLLTLEERVEQLLKKMNPSKPQSPTRPKSPKGGKKR